MSNHTHSTHGYGFDEDGNPVRIAEFPHDEVAERVDGPERGVDHHRIASVAVASVMSFALSRKAGKGKVGRLEALRGAAVRLLAMAWVWRHPHTSEYDSIRQMAKAHGMDDSAVTKLAREYAELNGIPVELTRKRWGGGDIRIRTRTNGQNESGHARRKPPGPS